MNAMEAKSRWELNLTARKAGYTVRFGTIQDPGKYEGEDIGVLYLDDLYGNGDLGEWNGSNPDTGEGFAAWKLGGHDSLMRRLVGADGEVHSVVFLYWSSSGFHTVGFGNEADAEKEERGYVFSNDEV